VPVAGIGSRHLSSAFVSFDVFFRGPEYTACIHIEARLVENLKAKLLIGMDVMGHDTPASLALSSTLWPSARAACPMVSLVPPICFSGSDCGRQMSPRYFI
jgi:hypothetical protein